MRLFNPFNYKILIVTIMSTLADMAAIVLLFPTLKVILGGDSAILSTLKSVFNLEISINLLFSIEICLICIAALTKIYLIQQIAKSAEDIRRRITIDTMAAVFKWTLKDYKSIGSTDLTRKILSETDVFVANYVYPVYSLYLHCTVILISVCTLLITDARAVLFAGSFLILCLGFLLLIVNRKLKYFSSERETLNSERFKYVTDRVDAFEDQHFFPSLSSRDDRYIELFDRFANVNSSLQTISQLAKPVFELVIFSIMLLAGFFLATRFSITDQLSDDKVVAIAAALYRLLPGVAGIYQARSQIKIGTVSSQAIRRILDGAVNYVATPIPSTIYSIKVSEIEISHGKKIIHVPEGIFRKGEITLINGPSGCGKSSFLHVICGLTFAKSGTLEINGEELRAYLNLNWFDKISYVGQKPNLVGKIVSDNFSKAEYSRLEIILFKFGLITEQMKFNDILEREVDTLSGGQRQKIALARAALKDSEIIIMDEALNAQDPLSVRRIMDTLSDLDRIILVVSHELEIEKYCDQRINF